MGKMDWAKVKIGAYFVEQMANQADLKIPEYIKLRILEAKTRICNLKPNFSSLDQKTIDEMLELADFIFFTNKLICRPDKPP